MFTCIGCHVCICERAHAALGAALAPWLHSASLVTGSRAHASAIAGSLLLVLLLLPFGCRCRCACCVPGSAWRRHACVLHTRKQAGRPCRWVTAGWSDGHRGLSAESRAAPESESLRRRGRGGRRGYGRAPRPRPAEPPSCRRAKAIQTAGRRQGLKVPGGLSSRARRPPRRGRGVGGQGPCAGAGACQCALSAPPQGGAGRAAPLHGAGPPGRGACRVVWAAADCRG